MRIELNDFETDQVTGGTVVFSNIYNAVAFTTLGERYDLTGVSWRDARNLTEDLCLQNKGMGEKEFDTYIRDLFKSNGWLSPYTRTRQG